MLGSFFKVKRFDCLKKLHGFQRYLDDLDVWYNPKIEITSEGLYALSYDRGEFLQMRWEKQGIPYDNVNRAELEEDLFM